MYFSYSVFHGNDFQILQPNQKYDLDKKGTIDFLETEIKTNELKEQNNTRQFWGLFLGLHSTSRLMFIMIIMGSDGLKSVCVWGGGGEPF